MANSQNEGAGAGRAGAATPAGRVPGRGAGRAGGGARGGSLPVPHDVLFPAGVAGGRGLGRGRGDPGENAWPSRPSLLAATATGVLALGVLFVTAAREIGRSADAGGGGGGVRDVAPGYAFRELVSAFLSAPTPEEKLAMLRGGPEVDGTRVREFYRERPAVAHTVHGIAPLRTDGFPPGCVAAFYAYLDGGDERIVAIVEDDGGRHRIDWGAFARVEPLPWGAFGRGLATGTGTADAEFRLLVTESDYYNHAFSSEGDWVSYQLRRPDREGDVFGYVRRGSALARKLRGRVGGGVAQRLILRLRGNGDSVHRHQFLITELVSTEWVR